KLQKKDFYRSEHQKRKDEFCPFSSLADFNPLQLTKSLYLLLNFIIKKPTDQARKLAAGCSKHCFEVVDRTDEVSSKHCFEVVDEADVV
ncbi:hypothetical protein ACLVTF_03180, partial [Streptococcus pneumoniae]